SPLDLQVVGRDHDDDALHDPGFEEFVGDAECEGGLACAWCGDREEVRGVVGEVSVERFALPLAQVRTIPAHGRLIPFPQVAGRAERLSVDGVGGPSSGPGSDVVAVPAGFEFGAAVGAASAGGEVHCDAFGGVEAPSRGTVGVAAGGRRRISHVSSPPLVVWPAPRRLRERGAFLWPLRWTWWVLCSFVAVGALSHEGREPALGSHGCPTSEYRERWATPTT